GHALRSLLRGLSEAIGEELTEYEADARELEESYKRPHRFDDRRLLPFFGLEMQKPRFSDIAGFVISVGVCFLFIAIAVWLANIGR
ncbi:MAG: hypothetical protein KY475_05215, partial [Planctomycetes bacterium]|nr:hypothetical protein [Planctomycetota bacterium]